MLPQMIEHHLTLLRCKTGWQAEKGGIKRSSFYQIGDARTLHSIINIVYMMVSAHYDPFFAYIYVHRSQEEINTYM